MDPSPGSCRSEVLNLSVDGHWYALWCLVALLDYSDFCSLLWTLYPNFNPAYTFFSHASFYCQGYADWVFRLLASALRFASHVLEHYSICWKFNLQFDLR